MLPNQIPNAFVHNSFKTKVFCIHRGLSNHQAAGVVVIVVAVIAVAVIVVVASPVLFVFAAMVVMDVLLVLI
jgi:hypothetical protein